VANSDYKTRIKNLTQKLSKMAKFSHPVGFFNSYQEKKIEEFAIKNPHSVIFTGEDLLED